MTKAACPKLGQFQQQSMAPFTEQLKNAASGFAGETGLTLDDLGFLDNPSSAEAIKITRNIKTYELKKLKRFWTRILKCWIFGQLV